MNGITLIQRYVVTLQVPIVLSSLVLTVVAIYGKKSKKVTMVTVTTTMKGGTMPEQRQSIKETTELIKAVGLVTAKALAISKDGLELSDVPRILELFKEYSVIEEGFKGLALVDDELKDLDADESAILAVELFTQYKLCKRAITHG